MSSGPQGPIFSIVSCSVVPDVNLIKSQHMADYVIHSSLQARFFYLERWGILGWFHGLFVFSEKYRNK